MMGSMSLEDGAPARIGAAFRRLGLGAAMAVSLAAPALAAPGDVSAALKARAVRACEPDARRLCPGTLFSELAAARCLSTKRPELRPACRRAYDRVAHALRR